MKFKSNTFCRFTEKIELKIVKYTITHFIYQIQWVILILFSDLQNI